MLQRERERERERENKQNVREKFRSENCCVFFYYNYPNFTDLIGMMISMTIGMETGDGLILILMKTENSLR